MKWLVLSLVLLNLLLAGYFHWTQSQAAALAGQNAPLNSSKIKLLSARVLNETPERPETGAAASFGEAICVEWRGLKEADLERSREFIKQLALRRVLSVEELPIDPMYWVVFPPLPSEAAAKVKINEMASLNIKDALIIREGDWKNAISLGVFGAEEAARVHLREQERKGLSGLRIERRGKQSSGYYYMVRSEDATTLRELDEIRLNFPASTLIRVACNKR